MQTSRHAKNSGDDSSNKQEKTDFKITQLSAGDTKPRWVMAVFAYNIAETIQMALKSIVTATDENDVSVYVLANGCTDDTLNKVRSYSEQISHLYLVEIPVADKANAWNIFVHDLFTDEEAKEFSTWFFMDGDVTLTANSMPLLEASLDNDKDAKAAGGMPGCGRNMDAWRKRMVANSMLPGNYYALGGAFVEQVRQFQIRMPVGLIGEDFFVSWMVTNIGWWESEPERRARCVFSGSAEFMFRSLSPLRLSDWKIYLRRKWRYTLRGIQHQMLILLLSQEGLTAMPATVEELYRRVSLPVSLGWSGFLQTPLNLIAAIKIRSLR